MDPDYEAMLDRLRKFRYQSATSQKYTVVVDGVARNKGDFRDNGWDILEEIADAMNIADLLWNRMGVEQQENPDAPCQRLQQLMPNVIRLKEDLEFCAEQILHIRDRLPGYMVRDQVEVTGPVDRWYYEQPESPEQVAPL